MSNANKELYEFDKFRLDVAERLLSREGERVPLSEKAFDTLCALVRRGNHLVRKEELLNEVWADAIVEENNLDKNISLLRQVLGERTGKGKFIETVRGHGFRFVPEVREVEEEEKGEKPSRENGTATASVLVGEPMGDLGTRADRLSVTESQITDFRLIEFQVLRCKLANSKKSADGPYRSHRAASHRARLLISFSRLGRFAARLFTFRSEPRHLSFALVLST